MLSLILTCLLSGPAPQPLFERTAPSPVEVVGSIQLDGREYKVTNYTDLRVDDKRVARPRDVPKGATATRVSVVEKGFVTHLWFSTAQGE